MKTILSVLGLVSLLTIGTSAYADSAPGSGQNQSTANAWAVGQSIAQSASVDQGGTGSGSWASGAPNRGLTRQEIREQLIQAENDGELKTLDSTLYSRP